MTKRSYKIFFLISFLISSSFIFNGCTSGSYEPDTDDSNKNPPKEKSKEPTDYNTSETNSALFSTAKTEQLNPMYSPSVDSTYLYWLNNKLLVLGWTTKCNIFALNTLYKSGYKTPKVNTLCRDMFDTTRFNDIFPYIPLKTRFTIEYLKNDTTEDHSEEITQLRMRLTEEMKNTLQQGDMVIWKGHVILFDKFVPSKKKLYAMAWWAGTSQADNGDNVLNNVIYGKYPIEGSFIIRRPQKR